jgi:hypothetical protein
MHHYMEILEGWNSAIHGWKLKAVEVCTNCEARFRTMRNNALCEAERKVHEEFLEELMESIYGDLL